MGLSIPFPGRHVIIGRFSKNLYVMYTHVASTLELGIKCGEFSG